MLSIAFFDNYTSKKIWYKISIMSVKVSFHILDTENVKNSLAIFTQVTRAKVSGFNDNFEITTFSQIVDTTP